MSRRTVKVTSIGLEQGPDPERPGEPCVCAATVSGRCEQGFSLSQKYLATVNGMTGIALVFPFLLVLCQAHSRLSSDVSTASIPSLCFSVPPKLCTFPHTFQNDNIRRKKGVQSLLCQSHSKPAKFPAGIKTSSSSKEVNSLNAVNNAGFDLAKAVINTVKWVVTTVVAKSIAVLHIIISCKERFSDLKGIHYVFMQSVFVLYFISLASGTRPASATPTSTLEERTAVSQPASHAQASSRQHTLAKPMLTAGVASSAAAAAVSRL